jgi:hypothetical protein
MRARHGEWVWLARHLCPSCRANEREFWFGRRSEQPRNRQLVLFGDAEAPIDLDADWTFRRTRPGYRKWLGSPWNAG